MTNRVAVARVEKRYEGQGDPDDDQRDVAIANLETPEIENRDFADAEQEKAEAGKTEAALLDGESEEECSSAFNSETLRLRWQAAQILRGLI